MLLITFILYKMIKQNFMLQQQQQKNLKNVQSFINIAHNYFNLHNQIKSYAELSNINEVLDFIHKNNPRGMCTHNLSTIGFTIALLFFHLQRL